MDKNLLALSPVEFITFLREEKISRFYFAFDDLNSTIISSHSQLTEIAEFLKNDNRDFNTHEGIFIQVSRHFNVLHCAFIHRTNRGQAAGGVRFWNYDKVEDFLRDGLRLAMGMTYKNALAGLWWGGGKGVMTEDESIDKNDSEIRKILYSEYGELMTSLNGCYVTAEDVGTKVSDMANVFSKTRFTTCIPAELGGSGNPSIPTARGVVSGMEAGLHFLDKTDLNNKIIVVQGLGNVARPMIKFLLEKNVKHIYAGDIFEQKVEEAYSEINNERVTFKLLQEDDRSLYLTECDIFSPCAVGATLNSRTIPTLNCKIVCGAANNQLEDPIEDDKRLFEKGILYVPDFLTNRMGIVNCADEQAGYIKNDPLIERHLDQKWEFSIYRTALNVFKTAGEKNETTGRTALKIAEEMSIRNNPIYGHRGKTIIKSLIANEWQNKNFDNYSLK
ncbi:MAG: hypothetical protein K9J12_00820 [Melioribacteraceae bacterium]|nr:hypothetical protein [Melioribacteraceae bacterium]MCF8413378.1 hypothetical protein [Melioribacteraceae bacterium]MCF8431875.1 hypothetical protein [Melioribacteraceae bacterium]